MPANPFCRKRRFIANVGWRWSALTILCLTVATAGWSQFPGSRSGGQGSFGNSPGISPADTGQEELELDTFKIYYQLASDPFRRIGFADTAINRWVHQYDPTRQRRWDHRHLGAMGTASEPIVFEPLLRRGFSVGLNQFDLYYLPAAQMPFYSVERPFMQVNFGQLGEQNNSLLNIQFGRSFGPGFSVSLDYHRSNINGNLTLFPEQRSRNTALGLGFHFQRPGSRYESFLTFTNNRINTFDHGGVIDIPLSEEFPSPDQAIVQLQGARTRHQHQEVLYQQYFSLNRRDTLGRPRQQFFLAHRGGYANHFYRFSDPANTGTGTDNAGTYYRAFLQDSRGLRSFIEHQKLENALRLITLRMNDSVGAVTSREVARVELGVLHAWHQIRQEPRDSVLNEVFLTGQLDLSPRPGLALRSSAQLGLLGNIGDYQIKGELDLRWGKHLQFKAAGLNQLASPTLVQQEFWVTGQQIWSNEFRKTLGTHLQGNLEWEPWNLELGAGFHLLNNFIYSDTSGIIRQSGVPITVIQAFLRKDFQLWKIHLDNDLAWQTSSEKILRLPALFGKHSLYFEGKLFKVLDTRIGVDLRYQTDFLANTYFPLTGQFRLNDRQTVGWFPGLDVYGSFRVTKFRAFFKWEDLGRLFLTNQYFYQTAYYPLPPGSGFRFGFKWRFTD